MYLSYEDSQKINALVAKKKYPAAVKLLRGMLAEDPNNVQLRKQLGEFPSTCLTLMLICSVFRATKSMGREASGDWWYDGVARASNWHLSLKVVVKKTDCGVER